MKSLRDAIADYLTLRRSLGFKLRATAASLIEFASFLEQKAAYLAAPPENYPQQCDNNVPPGVHSSPRSPLRSPRFTCALPDVVVCSLGDLCVLLVYRRNAFLRRELSAGWVLAHNRKTNGIITRATGPNSSSSLIIVSPCEPLLTIGAFQIDYPLPRSISCILAHTPRC